MQLGIAASNPGEEFDPDQALAARGDGCDLGAIILGRMGPLDASPKVDNATRRVQQPVVAIPQIDRGGVRAIGFRELLDRPYGLRARDRDGDTQPINFERCFTTDRTE
jgi:hypothetical protein